MMVFFFSNMIENQMMSTGAFEVTLNGEPLVAATGVLSASANPAGLFYVVLQQQQQQQ